MVRSVALFVTVAPSVAGVVPSTVLPSVAPFVRRVLVLVSAGTVLCVAQSVTVPSTVLPSVAPFVRVLVLVSAGTVLLGVAQSVTVTSTVLTSVALFVRVPVSGGGCLIIFLQPTTSSHTVFLIRRTRCVVGFVQWAAFVSCS
jgi:hypothetical protein